jgi:hypothetical protein
LTIFVRLLPRLLDPVHGPIQKCKTVLWLGLVWLPFGPRHTLRLTQLCHRATKTAVVQHRTMRRGTIARITMLAGVARALLSRGRPRVARPARQLRSSAPLRMAASTLEGLRNVAIVAHVRSSVRTQYLRTSLAKPRNRADAAAPSRTTHASNAMCNLHAVEHTTSIKHAGRPRQDDVSGCLAAGIECF